jgi:hypothetical protein
MRRRRIRGPPRFQVQIVEVEFGVNRFELGIGNAEFGIKKNRRCEGEGMGRQWNSELGIRKSEN